LTETGEAIAAIADGLAERAVDKALGGRIHHAAGSCALIGAVKLRDALVALEDQVAQGAALHQSDGATLQQIWRATREELHRHAQHH
jgi:hypothetical protein